jgi:hypothetical protein
VSGNKKSWPFFGITAQRREQGGVRKQARTQHHTSPYFFHLLTMTIIAALSLGGCTSARSQDTNLPLPPPSPPHPKPPTAVLRSLVAITVCPSADQFLPRHETNFFVPPSHCSKPLLHEQPSFIPALFSKKRPRHFRGQKVSTIWFVICIFVFKK